MIDPLWANSLCGPFPASLRDRTFRAIAGDVQKVQEPEVGCVRR